MAFKIDASSLVTRHSLTVQSDGVKYVESTITGSVRRFRFNEIECVMMSSANVLSFQVGQEVFSIPTRADKIKHQEVIATLINEVRRANGLE